MWVLEAITHPSALLSGGMILFVFFLTIYHAVLVRKQKKYSIWKVLCLLPAVACIVHLLCYNFGRFAINSLLYFGTMYLVAILIAVWQFFCNKRILYRVFAFVIILCAVFSYIYMPAGTSLPSNLHCYTSLDWSTGFEKTVRAMEKEYSLSSWKKIDYDQLLDDFIPRIEEAERTEDIAALGIVLNDYCNRFYDGHVFLQPANSEIAKEANQILTGNDYGLSLITLENGDVVAICVEPGSEAEHAGMHNGTIVTKWNGVAVEKAKYAYALPVNPPVEENEEPTRTMLLAGQGGDAVEITFLADNGEEITVTLKRVGYYLERYQQVYAAFCGMMEARENFTYKMISDTCGYLAITSEEINLFQTLQAVFTGRLPSFTQLTDSILSDLKSQGMTELIIDIRNNTGGFPQVSAAVASVFYQEDYLCCYECTSVHSNRPGEPFIVEANGKWKDLPTVVLVNQNTVSSGDVLAELLGRCPNITLMGMTPSNCSYQTTGGCAYLADGNFAVYYPTGYSTDLEGNPKIDTNAERQTRIPLEEKIPVNEAAIQGIFSEEAGEYEIFYAMQWLRQAAITAAPTKWN